MIYLIEVLNINFTETFIVHYDYLFSILSSHHKDHKDTSAHLHCLSNKILFFFQTYLHIN